MPQGPESGREVDKLKAEVERLQVELAQAQVQRDEARGWARSEYHQMWDAPFLPDHAPGWLTDPM